MTDPQIRPGVTSRIYRPGETPEPDRYWLERSVEERLEGVWLLTKLCLAWTHPDPDELRLQRSVVNVQRPPR